MTTKTTPEPWLKDKYAMNNQTTPKGRNMLLYGSIMLTFAALIWWAAYFIYTSTRPINDADVPLGYVQQSQGIGKPPIWVKAP